MSSEGGADGDGFDDALHTKSGSGAPTTMLDGFLGNIYGDVVEGGYEVTGHSTGFDPEIELMSLSRNGEVIPLGQLVQHDIIDMSFDSVCHL